MPAVRFHLLTSVLPPNKFFGDRNQLLGIKNAYEALNPAEIETKEWNDANPEELQALQAEIESDSTSKQVILSAGDHGLAALQKLSVKKSVLSIWSGHQQFPELKEAIDKINVVALPKHAIDQKFRDHLPKHIQLIETIGVAHAVTKESITKSYAEWQASETPIMPNENYIVVVLGGDAPDSEKNMKYFSSEEAEILAKHIAKLALEKNAHVLITNCARTSREVTEKFLKVLEKNNISKQFFPFNAKSAYQPMLGALLTKSSYLAFVTGDSTSMATEMSDHLSPQNLIFVRVGSMNKTHHAHINTLKAARLGSVIKLDLDEGHYEIEKLEAKEAEFVIKHKPAALKIAMAIDERLPLSQSFHFFGDRHMGVDHSSAQAKWRFGKGNVFLGTAEPIENENAVRNTDAIIQELKVETDQPSVILESQYGNGIHVVDQTFLENNFKDTSKKHIVIKGDGLFTTLTNVALLNKSGDAHPIVFESDKAIGILVGSWKCLSQNIIQMMLKHFENSGIQPRAITVYIGPGLGRDSYSIGTPTRDELVKVFGEEVDIATTIKPNLDPEKANHAPKYLLNVHALMAEYGKSFGFQVISNESDNTFDKTQWKLIKKQAIEERNPTMLVNYYAEQKYFGARLFARVVRQISRIDPQSPYLDGLQGDVKNVKEAAKQGRYNETGRDLNGVVRLRR